METAPTVAKDAAAGAALGLVGHGVGRRREDLQVVSVRDAGAVFNARRRGQVVNAEGDRGAPGDGVAAAVDLCVDDRLAVGRRLGLDFDVGARGLQVRAASCSM
jgi:hypothetical protein